MPFTKVGKNKWESPSGKKYTKDQLSLYYMTDGFKKKLPKEKK